MKTLTSKTSKLPHDLKKCDHRKLAAGRYHQKFAARCLLCGKTQAFKSDKWWIRNRTVRVVRKVCRHCRRAFLTYEVPEPLYKTSIGRHQTTPPRNSK